MTKRHLTLPTNLRVPRGLRLWRETFAELDDLVELVAKIFQSRQGDDNGVATAIDFLDDPQEAPSRVFPQVKREMLPLDPDALVL